MRSQYKISFKAWLLLGNFCTLEAFRISIWLWRCYFVVCGSHSDVLPDFPYVYNTTFYMNDPDSVLQDQRISKTPYHSLSSYERKVLNSRRKMLDHLADLLRAHVMKREKKLLEEQLSCARCEWIVNILCKLGVLMIRTLLHLCIRIIGIFQRLRSTNVRCICFVTYLNTTIP